MFKLVFLFASIACAAAGGVIYPEFAYRGLPSASGYEYSASVQTPDYVNHQSVNVPLAPAPLEYRGAIAYSGWPGALRTYEAAPVFRQW